MFIRSFMFDQKQKVIYVYKFAYIKISHVLII